MTNEEMKIVARTFSRGDNSFEIVLLDVIKRLNLYCETNQKNASHEINNCLKSLQSNYCNVMKKACVVYCNKSSQGDKGPGWLIGIARKMLGDSQDESMREEPIDPIFKEKSKISEYEMKVLKFATKIATGVNPPRSNDPGSIVTNHLYRRFIETGNHKILNELWHLGKLDLPEDKLYDGYDWLDRDYKNEHTLTTVNSLNNL